MHLEGGGLVVDGGGGVQDKTVAGGLERLEGGLAHVEAAHQVDVDDGPEPVTGNVLCGRAEVAGSVVNENVQAAEGGHHVLDDLEEIVEVRPHVFKERTVRRERGEKVCCCFKCSLGHGKLFQLAVASGRTRVYRVS